MRDLVVLAIILGSVPVILSRPYIGVLMWAWISYMNPHRLTYGYAYEFPVAATVVGALFIGMLFSQEQKKIPWNATTAVWLLFVLWTGVTTIFALVPDDAFLGWKKTMKIQLITFVTLMLMRNQVRINVLVAVIVLSLGFFGIKGGIFSLTTGLNYKVFGPPDSFFEDNNALALALVMIIPLMRYLQMNTENRWLKRGLVAGMGLCALSVVASYSRGALLASAAMILFLALKSRQRGKLFLGLLVLAPLLFTLTPDKWYERMSTISSYQQDASAMGRINAWTFAYNLASDRPLVGGGFDAFDKKLFVRYAPNPEDFHDAHSIYFEVLGEQGFVGLGLFLLLGFLALRTGKRVERLTKNRQDFRWAYDLAAMTRVSLIGYVVGGAFLGLAYFDLYYHLIAILVLVRAVVEDKLRQEASQAGPENVEPARADVLARAGPAQT